MLQNTENCVSKLECLNVTADWLRRETNLYVSQSDRAERLAPPLLKIDSVYNDPYQELLGKSWVGGFLEYDYVTIPRQLLAS